MKNSDEKTGATAIRSPLGRWMANYKGIITLFALFFILLYTIMWASDKNIYQNHNRLLTNSFVELKAFCETEMASNDYKLEQFPDGIRIYLPTGRWFLSGSDELNPAMRTHLEKLAQKICDLRFSSFTQSDKSDTNLAPLNPDSNIVTVRLQFDGITTSLSNSHLFQARARSLAQFLNSNNPSLRCWIEPNRSTTQNVSFLVRRRPSTQVNSARVTLLIPAVILKP